MIAMDFLACGKQFLPQSASTNFNSIPLNLKHIKALHTQFTERGYIALLKFQHLRPLCCISHGDLSNHLHRKSKTPAQHLANFGPSALTSWAFRTLTSLSHRGFFCEATVSHQVRPSGLASSSCTSAGALSASVLLDSDSSKAFQRQLIVLKWGNQTIFVVHFLQLSLQLLDPPCSTIHTTYMEFPSKTF